MRRPDGFAFVLAALASLAGACSSASAAYEREMRATADEVARLARLQNVARLVVVDLSPADDRSTHLGRFLADDLNGKLGSRVEELGFSLCDRDGLGKLIAEHKLGTSGLLDRQQAVEVGRFCQAKAVVWGRYWLLGDRLKATFDILDTETAVQIGSAVLNAPLSDHLRALDESASPEATIQTLLAAPKRRRTQTDDHLPQTAVKGPFSVTLTECKFEGDDLFCRLTVRNETTATRRVDVGGGSLLVDNQNDAYEPSQITVGPRTLDLDSGDERLGYEIPANTTFNAALVFHTIRRQEKKAQILRVDLGRHGDAEFRGFLFSRD